MKVTFYIIITCPCNMKNTGMKCTYSLTFVHFISSRASRDITQNLYRKLIDNQSMLTHNISVQVRVSLFQIPRGSIILGFQYATQATVPLQPVSAGGAGWWNPGWWCRCTLSKDNWFLFVFYVDYLNYIVIISFICLKYHSCHGKTVQCGLFRLL